jgi:predicted DsbA family dithiol-disulfide isomerase
MACLKLSKPADVLPQLAESAGADISETAKAVAIKRWNMRVKSRMIRPEEFHTRINALGQDQGFAQRKP